MTQDERKQLSLSSDDRVAQPADDSEDLGVLTEANLRILDAVFHNAGIVASEDLSPPTPEELEDERILGEFIEKLIAQR